MHISLRRLRFGVMIAVLTGTAIGWGLSARGDQPPPLTAPPPKDADTKPCESAPGGTPCKPLNSIITRGTLKTEISLDGWFEAKNMAEIVTRPKEWADWSVLSAVPHGVRVARGDLLVSFDPDKIDRAIQDARSEQRVADLGLQQAQQELRTLESLTPLDLAASRRAQRVAEEDSKYFFEVGKPQSLKMADFMLKSAQERLEYQQEELRQLEKMYKADELTEETEAIVLKRAQDAVEQAQFFCDRAKIERDEAVHFTIPRSEERIQDSTQRANLNEEKSRIVLPVALDKQRIELEKLKVQRTRGEDKLAKLLADREAMNVKSPIDGVVYYGSADRGKWTGSSDDLRRGATITANKVFMTIVEPRPMFFRASVTEKQLANVRAGQQGEVKPTAFPDRKLKATVESVGAIPLSGGAFDCRLTLVLGDHSAELMPGMNGEAKLVPLEQPGALLAPVSALLADECEEGKSFVLRIGKDGKQEKTVVTVGKRNERQVEILAGVNEGDLVVTEPQKDAK